MYSEIVKAYLNDCNSRMQSNTIAEKFRHLKHFADYLGADTSIENITYEQGLEFIQMIQKIKGNKSANRYLRNMKATWNWHRHRILYNFWNAIKPYPEDKKVKFIPTEEDIKSVKACASEWECDFIDIILKTGARRGEILDLKWEEVDFDNNFLVLWTRKRKNGEKQSRLMPLSSELHNILLRRKEDELNTEYVFTNPKDGQKYNKDQDAIRDMMKNLCKKAEIKKFGFHALRHFISKKLMKSGKASISDIQNFLGHQRATTTDLYLNGLNHRLDHLTGILDG